MLGYYWPASRDMPLGRQSPPVAAAAGQTVGVVVTLWCIQLSDGPVGLSIGHSS